MHVCGVIAEYDPFHRGHERHLRLARESTGADYIVCVMSGFYTQRGMPALFPPDVRAEMALNCGADAVLQLPAAFSLREGDWFARGGVEILHRLGCVDTLCFGSETEDLSLMERAACLLEGRDAMLEEDIRAGLQNGLSYAAAQGQALCRALGPRAEELKRPNASLGLSYLRALKALGSSIRPVAVLRNGDYHSGEMAEYPSATAVRAAVCRGDWANVEKALPKAALPLMMQAVEDRRICPPEKMDTVLRYALAMLGEDGLRALPGVDEGLEKRILSAAREGKGREEILSLAKTRRYTRGRISRALCWAVLGGGKDALPKSVQAVQVLGFRQEARPLMRAMQQGGLPLVMKPAREEAMAFDMHCAEIWHMLAGRDMGEPYRRGPVMPVKR